MRERDGETRGRKEGKRKAENETEGRAHKSFFHPGKCSKHTVSRKQKMLHRGNFELPIISTLGL